MQQGTNKPKQAKEITINRKEGLQEKKNTNTIMELVTPEEKFGH